MVERRVHHHDWSQFRGVASLLEKRGCTGEEKRGPPALEYDSVSTKEVGVQTTEARRSTRGQGSQTGGPQVPVGGHQPMIRCGLCNGWGHNRLLCLYNKNNYL